MNAMQPSLKTNWLSGEVELTILVGADERKFIFHARSPKMQEAMRAGKVDYDKDVDLLATDLEELLRGLGYQPLPTCHLT